MRSGSDVRRTSTIWLAFICCGLSLFLCAGCGGKEKLPELAPVVTIDAVTDTNFKKEVLESPLPVVVDFWAPWCGPCLMLEPVVKELASEFAGKIRFVKVNIDQNPKLGGRFVLQGIPLLVVFRNGKAIGYAVGFGEETKKGMSDYLSKLDSIPDKPAAEIAIPESSENGEAPPDQPVELKDSADAPEASTEEAPSPTSPSSKDTTTSKDQ